MVLAWDLRSKKDNGPCTAILHVGRQFLYWFREERVHGYTTLSKEMDMAAALTISKIRAEHSHDID